MKIVKLIFLSLIGIMLMACGENTTTETVQREIQRTDILGAGATFPAPLITSWADDYRVLTRDLITVNYQSIGSGGGVRQFMEKTVMFGATESSLSNANMDLAKEQSNGLAFNMPITLGDVVVTYNVPGVDSGIVFSPENIADLFLGNIDNWNDARLKELNPTVNFPDLQISIAHRADGSGTTAIFTDYLTKVNEEWATKVGFGSSVNWPVGSGGNGNEGVAGIIIATPGSVGYNSLVYAALNNISYGQVINKSGNTINPSLEATSLSAAVNIPEDGRVSLTDTDAPLGYSIAGFAWVLVYENLETNVVDENSARELVRFLYWVVTEGQNSNESLSFARLPDAAQSLAIGMIQRLKFNGLFVGLEEVKNIIDHGF